VVTLAARVALVLAIAGVLGGVIAACSGAPQPVLAAPVDRDPAQQTSNGEVLGADQKSPERALAEGATTGHLAPGWTAGGDQGLKYDPKRDPTGPDPGSTRLEHVDGGAEVVPPKPSK
jgi:hypothetical protein